jgi:hypothetical protein
MKINVLFSATTILTASLFAPLLAAQAGPADDVTGAAKKLGSGSGYSWHSTTVVPADSRFKPGPTDGKTAGGLTHLTIVFGDNTTEIYMKGTNAVLTNPDGGWETLATLASDDQGPGRFMAGYIQNFKAPSAQVADLAAGTSNLALTNDAYAGDLTADAAKKLLTLRRGGNSTVSNPSGTVSFWVKDGQLTKYEFHVKGSVTFGGNDITVDRDTTVELKDVGATTIAVPDDVKKLMP